MFTSLFDLFSIGIGPSSSHTVGPMNACQLFLSNLIEKKQLSDVHRLEIRTYGSLALTGKGHGTDKALLMGMLGETPKKVDPTTIDAKIQTLYKTRTLLLAGQHAIEFLPDRDLKILIDQVLPYHSNAMRFTVWDKQENVIAEEVYYSIGGGFIVNDNEIDASITNNEKSVPYPFSTAAELFALCKRTNKSIAAIMLENEKTLRDEASIAAGLDEITATMMASVERGLKTEGILPGGLNVPRRAPALHRKLVDLEQAAKSGDHIHSIDWLDAYAIAVNEENAAGHRVVTAPTNGAAGVIPAIIAYYKKFHPKFNKQAVHDFLLTAAAIALLYKYGASLSAAEVGCQGEIGVASSMAAGALTATLGGSLAQVENAAEIAMEHHLGMTCDPIKGLVQIPCIERNAMGAVKAVNAYRLAIAGDGKHIVSLDSVITTMHRTGKDMMTNYKETSLGGLAVNVPEC